VTQKFRITLDLEITGLEETFTVADLQDALDVQAELDDELVPHASAEGSLENIEELS
jgi:hypothetical protein